MQKVVMLGLAVLAAGVSNVSTAAEKPPVVTLDLVDRV